MTKLLATLLVVIVCLLSGADAQKHAAKPALSTSHQLLSLKVKGTTRYTDQEILAASGLQLGQDAAEADFKEAARRLAASGLFSEVAYQFSYSDAGAKVEFQLADNLNNKLVPVCFENLVWFTDDELLAALQKRVPLFKQSLPESGHLPDEVTAALQSMLTEKHLPGRVDFMREAKPDGGDLVGTVYRVEEVSIRIHNVEFPGASPEQAVFLTRAAHILIGAEYLRSKIAALAKFDLLPLYLQRGYLKAAFALSDAHVVTGAEPNSEAAPFDEVEVDATLPVAPGNVYSISGVTWKGNSAVGTDEASRLFHLTTGQPADAVRLARDTENLTRLYRSRGYMTLQIKPDAQLDDQNNTVHYDMNITEGELYRMGELQILGVDTPSHDRLLEAWTLREGDPYNADFAKKFIDTASRLLPKGFQYTVKVEETLNDKDKAVDVTIRFKPL